MTQPFKVIFTENGFFSDYALDLIRGNSSDKSADILFLDDIEGQVSASMDSEISTAKDVAEFDKERMIPIEMSSDEDQDLAA